MSRILRETVRAAPLLRDAAPLADPRLAHAQFVELHNEPLLQQLYDSFRQHYPEVVFREPPRQGTLNLQEVLRSTYFFA